MLDRFVHNLRYSLKYRIAVIIFLLEACMMASVLGVTLNYSMQKSQQQRLSTEKVMMDLLGDLGRIALFTAEYGELQAYIEQVVDDPYIDTVILADRYDNTAVSNELRIIGLAMPDFVPDKDAQHTQSQHWSIKEISNSSGLLGTLAIRFSNESLFKANREVLNLGISIALSGMILIAIIGILIGHILTRKLEILKSVAHDFSRGDLGTRTGFDGKDEVSIVGHTFDDMAEQVAEQMNELLKSRGKLEQRVKERTEELAKAHDEAIQATRSKSAFLANMSHEIRTPLTAIIGFTESLQENRLSPEERDEYLSIIGRSSKHLLQIINDILDLSKIEADKLSVEYLKIHPAEIINDVEPLVRMLAEEKNLSIKIEYKTKIPESIISDPVRIKQILINLCNNAVKFTHQGSVTVSIHCNVDEEQLLIKVIDTGIGLTEEQINNLFQVFSQADSTTTRKYGGTGLGLHLSKQLANKLGGDISVNSSPGNGSCFTLSIPTGSLNGIRLIDGTSQQASKAKKSGLLVNKFPNARVLLAEDNEDNQRYISSLLQAIDVRFEIAQNGLEAVNMVLSGDYDLVLMDMQMPEMNGLDATAKLRNRNYDKPIIALTANYTSTDIDNCLAGGCSAHIAKPIERSIFFDTLTRYLTSAQSTGDDQSAAIPTESQQTDDFEDAIAEAINMFIERLPGIFTLICEKFEARDTDTVRELIHDLKGTSGNFGYDDLFAISKEMEELINNGLFNEFGVLLQDAEKIVQSIIHHPEQSSMIL